MNKCFGDQIMKQRVLVIAACVTVLISAPVFGQWLKNKPYGLPRTPDGKPILDAPPPKTPDGKIDITGLWEPAEILIGDISKNLKPGSVPFQPWAEALYKHRRETESKEDPTGWCVPGGVPRS